MGEVSSKSKNNSSHSKEKQIEENLERIRITFDALFRLFERLGTTFDAKKIVRLFLMTLVGQLRLKRVSLYLLLPGMKSLEEYHSLGVGKQAALPSIEADSVFVRWIKEANEPVHMDEFFASGATDDEADLLGRFVSAGFSYALPLDDQGELLGTIFFSGKVTNEKFTDFDKELLQMLVKFASITIKNAWLYQAVVLSKMELEKLFNVKKEFINHTSHELRTPLTVLKSALWSIESDEDDGNVLVDMSKDAVLRLENKIEQLLSLNDIELNESTFNLEPRDMSSLLEECLREAIPEIEEKQITVNVDDRARFREIMVDAAKMKIVLRSLIDNAVTFVERGGNINVTTSIMDGSPDEGEGTEIGDWNTALMKGFSIGQGAGTFRGYTKESRFERDVYTQKSGGGSHMVIRIRDDGIGIPEEEVRSLSEPFVRASNSTLTNVKGMGLGLSVSQKIIAGHGGRIFCRSAKGKGAEFSIWLPLKEKATI